MNKEMIVSSNGHEVVASILEEDQVGEIHIEREKDRGVVGNIYKGRVHKVLPGMQSAFVNIGLERDAFLYVSDVIDTLDEFDQLEAADEELESGPETAEPESSKERGSRQRNAGRGRSNPRAQLKPTHKIDELLEAGQDILVQVVKEH